MIPSGLILLHKQSGITSFDSLRDIKRALGTSKAGHTGTLDKFAEGLLLVLTGRALRLSRWFTHCDKQYEGTLCLGAETDTLDPEGEVIARAPLPSREAVEQVLAPFRGKIEQAPPAYSAIHIDGERASTLARRGETPAMRKRPVEIYRLELLSWEPPYAKIFVHCSGGTYIRSLARDIALAAKSRAHLTALVRTQVAGFKLEDAVKVGNGEWSPPLRSIDATVFSALGLPCLKVSPEDAQKIVHGGPLAHILPHIPGLPPPGESNAAAALFADDTFIAVIENSNGTWNYGYVYAHN
ncbi:MAG: tRNA pseudouridine(55) synthase TruB [Treponema sp.]|jgi:tRNA pseudouridine55 synthase|nr:tRNA pseudouridine(55) synthase TruB [Treponema sp.]